MLLQELFTTPNLKFTQSSIKHSAFPTVHNKENKQYVQNTFSNQENVLTSPAMETLTVSVLNCVLYKWKSAPKSSHTNYNTESKNLKSLCFLKSSNS